MGYLVSLCVVCVLSDIVRALSSCKCLPPCDRAFVENETYYAYYLITEHSPGEGFGVATSSDGQHWTDHGYVWHGPSWVNHRWWEGTGAVWRAADFNKTGFFCV